MMQNNYFEGPVESIPLDEQVTNPNIHVGRYSYYSGYYHGHSFDDCARYLFPDRDDVDKLFIGSFCSIATGVSFVMGGNQCHRLEWVSAFPFFYFDDDYTENAIDGFANAGDTVIGNDVWIGAEAMIMPGVQVGHGALIGARSMVTKNVEPYTIVGGNPAKPIRKRFSDNEIAMLLEMEWWNWPESQLKLAMKIICSSNVAELYEFWRHQIG